MQKVTKAILLMLCCSVLPISAQESADDEQYIRRVQQELGVQLQHFTDDFEQLYEAGCRPIRITDRTLQSGYYIRTVSNQVKMMSRNMQSLEVRWNAFTTANLPTMADNDSLMDMTTHVELLRQAITDTIAVQSQRCSAVSDFCTAEQFILAQDSIYAVLYNQAQALSMLQKLAPQLEKLKAKEQVRFEQIQSAYDKLQVAIETVPELHKHATTINEHYYAIKSISEKIQATEYKPFIQRIKDYLLGLACVAVLLIFINMITTKIQTAKKLRETLKQQELLNRNTNNFYPTI